VARASPHTLEEAVVPKTYYNYNNNSPRQKYLSEYYSFDHLIVRLEIKRTTVGDRPDYGQT